MPSGSRAGRLARRGAAAVLAAAAVTASAAVLPPVIAATPVPDASADGARIDDARALVDLLRRVEARYRGIGPFRLDFEQSFESATFGTDDSDRGSVLVDPPGRMLWTYDEPEGQRAVLDGRTMWLVEPEFRQVTRRERTEGQSDPLIDLLAGRLDLLRVFAARRSSEPPTGPGRDVVELVPRAPRDDVEIAVAEIDRRTADLRRLVVIDPLGSRYEMRLGPPESAGTPGEGAFDVTVPDGWTLVRD